MFELFGGLPRQGPGSAASTRRALNCIPELTSESRILDLGCGTGAQTLFLAKFSPGEIVAIDSHEPYVTVLNKQATELGVADRVIATEGDMRDLNFLNTSFDLIWCEGAIYNIGVETALKEWRRLLRYEGHLVFTEVCWIHSDPPEECRLFWEDEYPAIRHVKDLLEAIKTCSYEVLDHFALPKSDWWDDYYRPLQDKVDAFRATHVEDADAQQICDQCEREINVWLNYAAYYGYEFFVLRDEAI